MAHAHAAHKGPSYFIIWVYLVALVGIGLLVFEFPISKGVAVAIIFSIALLKAFLVVRHYMHLKGVPPALYAVVGVPVVLAIVMVLLLFPDIGFHLR